MNETARTEVNNLNLASRVALDQNVLWLEVAVDESQAMDEVKGCQNLLRDFLKASYIKVRFLFYFSVVLAILIKVISEQLCHNEEVLLVVEVIIELEKVLIIEVFAIRIDISEKLDFVN